MFHCLLLFLSVHISLIYHKEKRGYFHSKDFQGHRPVYTFYALLYFDSGSLPVSHKKPCREGTSFGQNQSFRFCGDRPLSFLLPLARKLQKQSHIFLLYIWLNFPSRLDFSTDYCLFNQNLGLWFYTCTSRKPLLHHFQHYFLRSPACQKRKIYAGSLSNFRIYLHFGKSYSAQYS